MLIQSSAEWWQQIEQHWDEIVGLLANCQPGTPLREIEQLKRTRNARLARPLQQARRHAPARRQRRGHRGWQILTDLCAEQWVLHQALA